MFGLGVRLVARTDVFLWIQVNWNTSLTFSFQLQLYAKTFPKMFLYPMRRHKTTIFKTSNIIYFLKNNFNSLIFHAFLSQYECKMGRCPAEYCLVEGDIDISDCCTIMQQ